MSWMAWTWPTGIFFGVIFLMLVSMLIWELRSPSVARRGLLPLQTTRGDRLFIALLTMAFVNLVFLFAAAKLAPLLGVQTISQWYGFALSLVAAAAVARFG